MGETEPIVVVKTFLEALERGNWRGAAALLDEGAVWINVGLPAIRGRRRIVPWLRLLARPRVGFRVHLHAIAADGPVVLTERDDALRWGRAEQRFWVWGRFEVQDGRITLWRDSFDNLDYTRSLARALLGAATPALNRPWPLR